MSPEEFKQWRKSRNLTQDDLANALGLTSRSIQMMEKGERPIERRTVLSVLYLSEHPEALSKTD